MGVKSDGNLAEIICICLSLLQLSIGIIRYQHVGCSCLRLHEIPEHSHESVRERVKVDVEFSFYSIISDRRLGSPAAFGGVGIESKLRSGDFWMDNKLGSRGFVIDNKLESRGVGIDNRDGSRWRLTVNVVFRICLVGLVVVDHLYHLE